MFSPSKVSRVSGASWVGVSFPLCIYLPFGVVMTVRSGLSACCVASAVFELSHRDAAAEHCRMLFRMLPQVLYIPAVGVVC